MSWGDEDPVDTYPGCYAVYNSLSAEMRDQIAVAIIMAGKPVAAKQYGLTEVISVWLFHPSLDEATAAQKRKEGLMDLIIKYKLDKIWQ